MSKVMIRKILALCSRDRGHDEVYRRLVALLDAFDSARLSWEELIFEAENQSISPLVHKHIAASGYAPPFEAERLLRTLYLRHTRANMVRNEEVAAVLSVFRDQGIDCLLLKGIALSNILYQEPGLRAMRDIDILVSKEDVHAAWKLLLDLGFSHTPHARLGAEHHHLEPLVKTVGGLPIVIEVHHRLLPEPLHDSSWSYENIRETALGFAVHGISARTLGPEHALHYLYLHGFRAPLTYEPFRLIHVADLVSLVERNFRKIDRKQLLSSFPAALTVLSRLHFLTPWRPTVLDAWSLELGHVPDQPGVAYCGWPFRRLKKVPLRELRQFAADTFWPPQWWIQVHYGRVGIGEYIQSRFLEHPRTLWRWAKAYWRESTKR